jgi:uncharacterized membrane protein (Fun14 family)
VPTFAESCGTSDTRFGQLFAVLGLGNLIGSLASGYCAKKWAEQRFILVGECYISLNRMHYCSCDCT